MKEKRQEKILELINQYDIETQAELTRRLIEEGFSSTQGTTSRDIRELKLTKVTGSNGRQKYAPVHSEDLHISEKYRKVLTQGIIRMEGAENILVIKTVPGMAMACAAAIDASAIHGVVGSIAGDDTILCVLKKKELVDEVIEDLNQIIHEVR